MKRLGEKIAFVIGLLVKLPRNILSWFICHRMQMIPGRVMCWAYNFKQYGCNPKYLTDYLLEHNENFEIYWVFRRGIDTSQVDKRVKVVKFRSWEYLKLLATAEFFVTNSRTLPYHIYWHKRPEQKYLMLWHGGVALKKIERDAEKNLGYGYLCKAKADSRIASLMISSCRMHSNLIRHAFGYNGEVLERGIPRNDVFFQTDRHADFKKRIFSTYNIDNDSHIVLYAPTFRRNHSIEPYRINWSVVHSAIREKFGLDKLVIVVRLHPNLIGKVNTQSLVSYNYVVDATNYHDMQELLCIADMLITDYSSSMFDFAMLRKPCILYATDVAQYDRGYYFNFKQLPFPLAESENELLSILKDFNEERYLSALEKFYEETIGLYEDGHASESIACWMRNHRS